MLSHYIFIVFYTILFNSVYSLKQISFKDQNIQYVGHWHSDNNQIQQSRWPGAYFKLTVDKTFSIQLQLNITSNIQLNIQLNEDPIFSVLHNTTTKLNLFPNGLASEGPHTLTVFTTEVNEPFKMALNSIWLDDTGFTVPITPSPLIQFIGHDLTLGIHSSQSLFTSFSYLSSRKYGLFLDYSLMAYQNATLLNGLDNAFIDLNQPQPWSVVILLGANDNLDSKDQYQLTFEAFLKKIRSQLKENTPIFVLSEPLGDMFYPSQQSVINRSRQGDSYIFFIDTTSWIRYGSNFYLDRGHLTDAGHDLLAKKLIPFIQTKLNRPKDPLPGPPPNPNLPGDWQTMDIGQDTMIGLPGTVSTDSSTTFTLWGSGADIDNEVDAFRFVYEPFSSQGILESTIRSHSTFAKCAKAGIMIREHLGHGSPYLMLGISPADGIFVQVRRDNFGSTQLIKKLRASPPYRLRLVRQNHRFLAQIRLVENSNGVNTHMEWETFLTVPFRMAHDVYAGLAVTSCDTSVVSVAKFADVQVYHLVTSNQPHFINQQPY